MRGQGAGEHGDGLNEMRVELLAETVDAFREENVVDAILEIGVFAAQVDLAEGVLGHAGHVQEHIVEAGVRTNGQGIDLHFVDLEGGGSETRHDVLTGFVELAGYDEGLEGHRGLVDRGVAGRFVAGEQGGRDEEKRQQKTGKHDDTESN